jgi:hypothetical protein
MLMTAVSAHLKVRPFKALHGGPKLRPFSQVRSFKQRGEEQIPRPARRARDDK